MVERWPHKPVVDGPIPSATTKVSFRLVSSAWTERLPSKQGVGSSNLSRGSSFGLRAALLNIGGESQLAEHLLCKQTVAGSKPVTSTIFLGVAHLVERVLWEHEARGSSPLTETIFRLTLDR